MEQISGFEMVKEGVFISEAKATGRNRAGKNEFYVKIKLTPKGTWFVGVYDELYEDLYSEQWFDSQDEAIAYANSLVGKVPTDSGYAEA